MYATYMLCPLIQKRACFRQCKIPRLWLHLLQWSFKVLETAKIFLGLEIFYHLQTANDENYGYSDLSLCGHVQSPNNRPRHDHDDEVNTKVRDRMAIVHLKRIHAVEARFTTIVQVSSNRGTLEQVSKKKGQSPDNDNRYHRPNDLDKDRSSEYTPIEP